MQYLFNDAFYIYIYIALRNFSAVFECFILLSIWHLMNFNAISKTFQFGVTMFIRCCIVNSKFDFYALVWIVLFCFWRFKYTLNTIILWKSLRIYMQCNPSVWSLFCILKSMYSMQFHAIVNNLMKWAQINGVAFKVNDFHRTLHPNHRLFEPNFNWELHLYTFQMDFSFQKQIKLQNQHTHTHKKISPLVRAIELLQIFFFRMVSRRKHTKSNLHQINLIELNAFAFSLSCVVCVCGWYVR